MSDLDPHFARATIHKLGRGDLGVFVAGAFRALQDEPYLRNWHVEAICHRLTQVSEGRDRRLIVTMPPRTMKSFIASICLPAWLLGRNPAEKIICASYAQDLSDDFAFQMRKLMQSAFYRSVFPNTHLDPKKQTTSEIKTTRGGYRLSTSTGGTLTGRGASIIIIDDPIKAKDAHSEVVRESAFNWFTGTVVSRLNNPKTGRIIVVAQRLHMEDLPGQLLAMGGWEELCLPLVNDKQQEIEVSPGFFATRGAGNILHEDRFGDEEVTRLRAEMGERDFEAQYNQRPLPAGGALFKLSWLKRYDAPPPAHQTQGIFQSWDTAYDIAEGNDYSVCSTWALSGKNCYLLHIYRERLEFPELEKAIYRLRKEWKADLVIVENIGSGKSVGQNIRNAGTLWLYALKPQGSKQDRASQQSPKFERGEVWVPNEASWLKTFEDELAMFPQSKFDDQVDSVIQFLASVDTGRLLHLAEAARRF